MLTYALVMVDNNNRLSQIKTILGNEELLPKQIAVMKKFDFESEKNLGFSIATRYNQVCVLQALARKVKKPFERMTKKDIENYIYGLELSPASTDLHKLQIKKFFVCQMHKPGVVDWIRFSNHKKRKLPEDILTPAEVKALIEAADNSRDRALVAILYESGARLDEIIKLKLTNVETDQYGIAILVDGKTGMRRIRLIDSVPYIIQWLNDHPRKDNPNSRLFVRFKYPDRGLGEQGIQKLLKTLMKRAGISKNVHPHLFRHSRATHMAKDFSESDLKIVFGWTPGSNMPAIYIHRSGADVDKKILQRAGLLDQEEAKEDDVLKPRNCPRCKETNPATAGFCYKCGMALNMKTAMEVEQNNTEILLTFLNMAQRNPRLIELLKNLPITH